MPSSTLSPPPAHRLESTPLRVRVVPPSPTHGRLDRPLVDRLLHVYSKRFEVREERVHHLFQDPNLDPRRALRHDEPLRVQAVRGPYHVRSLLARPGPEATSRQHRIRALIRLHAGLRDHRVVELQRPRHLTVLEARVEKARVDVDVRLEVEALARLLDHREGLVKPTAAAKQLHKD